MLAPQVSIVCGVGLGRDVAAKIIDERTGRLWFEAVQLGEQQDMDIAGNLLSILVTVTLVGELQGDSQLAFKNTPYHRVGIFVDEPREQAL